MASLFRALGVGHRWRLGLTSRCSLSNGSSLSGTLCATVASASKPRATARVEVPTRNRAKLREPKQFCRDVAEAAKGGRPIEASTIAAVINAIPDGSLLNSDIMNLAFDLRHRTPSPSTYALLAALAPKIRSCPEPFGMITVSSVLFGCRRLDFKVAGLQQLRTFIKALTVMVEKCEQSWGAQAVGNALYGLQGLGGDAMEVRQLISVLARKIDR